MLTDACGPTVPVISILPLLDGLHSFLMEMSASSCFLNLSMTLMTSMARALKPGIPFNDYSLQL